MSQRFYFIRNALYKHWKDILFFNLKNLPILLSIYGGLDYSKQVEDMKDNKVVMECLKVLRKLCERAIKLREESLRMQHQVDLTIPDWTVDYFLSCWGSNPYILGAFLLCTKW
jgi:hypothetical protein